MSRDRTEWSLVVFTVATQAAAGICALGAVLGEPRPTLALVFLALGFGWATLHLGRPAGARFALANLHSSWLSRELLLGALFAAAVVAQLATGEEVVAWLAAALGLVFVLAVSRVYAIRTVPAWNTWATPVAFFGTALLLSAALLGQGPIALVTAPALLLATYLHLSQLRRGDAAAVASAAIVASQFRGLFMLRVFGALVGAAIAMLPSLVATVVASALLVASELLGRFLFYASHRRVGL